MVIPTNFLSPLNYFKEGETRDGGGEQGGEGEGGGVWEEWRQHEEEKSILKCVFTQLVPGMR